MKKIVGLILLASLTACGGGGGGGGATKGGSSSGGSTGGSTAVSTQAPERSVLKLSVGDVQKLSSVVFSSASITGFEAPSQSK
ncbi:MULTISPECIES: hypothetical protein [Vibrio]|uniref:Uncharacterized protein n=2 Tax=Vibrio TaxID=662 RepID=A0A1C3J2Y8_9VIBR|nr:MULTISPECIES: hypothetical protein [Vibrio]OEF47232.1 hypothetical protein A163_07030 [Vibrio tasmaniensis 1F-267]SBS67928.1 hypothetical protein VAT7223_03962 [Vibrio atlanticus]